MPEPKQFRFLLRYKKTGTFFRITQTGCWEWTRGLTADNYGEITYRGRQRPVHRVVASIVKNVDIDSPLDALHSCDNKRCFNPDHVFFGTTKENAQDASKKGLLKRTPATHCRRGHEISGSNVYSGETGRKRCLTCMKLSETRQSERAQAALERSRARCL